MKPGRFTDAYTIIQSGTLATVLDAFVTQDLSISAVYPHSRHLSPTVRRRTGKLLEKYDVITTDRPGGGGEYPTQDGFGSTNGVTRKLMALYPADADLGSVDQCPGREGG